jgi:preprotein translocase subunit SecA
MAGRGTDIVLGGNPDGYVEDILRERDIDPEFATDEDRAEARAEAKRHCDEDRERVLEAGGLYIVGTERHESRRIDNQLRGRAGRQGDPGESRFFVSLQDELMRRFGTDRVAPLLQKLGLDDDMPIENRMVSGILEQAQSKVEGYNFDIRKNVVEYDDVIAAQRAVIYQDRQAILAHEDLHERVMEMVDHEVERQVRSHTIANLPEDWDLDALVSQCDTWGIHIPDDVFPEEINRLKRETLLREVVEAARQQYVAKEEFVAKAAEEQHAVDPGDVVMRQFERAVLLQVVDTLWQDHIDHLDLMRSGIGLRGVAQRDPLVEFRREASSAFEQLKEEIEHVVTEYLFRAPVQLRLPEPPQEALPQNLRTNAEDIAKLSGQTKSAGVSAARNRAPVAARNPGGGKNGAARPQGARVAQGQRQQQSARRPVGSGVPQRATALATSPAGASQPSPSGRPGRNAPCYCGSGRKYKHCHGQGE